MKLLIALEYKTTSLVLVVDNDASLSAYKKCAARYSYTEWQTIFKHQRPQFQIPFKRWILSVYTIPCIAQLSILEGLQQLSITSSKTSERSVTYLLYLSLEASTPFCHNAFLSAVRVNFGDCFLQLLIHYHFSCCV